ncbi:MAG TPA: hypothetical protein VME70_01720 [Mycobacteriales bacterium]|nr:hypothetical protein [Mycobacteriales bacterium]
MSPSGGAEPPPYFAGAAPSGAGQPPPGWSAAPPPPPPYGWAPPPSGWGAPQAPRPGIIALRPLGVGEILDGAFTTIRRYPGATIGLATPVLFVVEALQLLTSYSFLNGINSGVTTSNDVNVTNITNAIGQVLTVDSIVAVVTLIATALLSGIVATVVGQGALGRPMSAGQAWHSSVPAIWRLLGASLAVLFIPALIAAASVLPGVVIALIGAGTSSHAAVVLGVALAVIGGIAGSVFALYVAISLSLTTPALMLEKQGIGAALRRSRVLVRGSWWRVFGITLLAGIIGAVIAGIIAAPFTLLGGGMSGIFSGSVTTQFRFTTLLLSGIGGLIGGVLVRPFTAAVIALLYLDRRMRAEGLDQTLQQAATAGTR